MRRESIIVPAINCENCIKSSGLILKQRFCHARLEVVEGSNVYNCFTRNKTVSNIYKRVQNKTLKVISRTIKLKKYRQSDGDYKWKTLQETSKKA